LEIAFETSGRPFALIKSQLREVLSSATDFYCEEGIMPGNIFYIIGVIVVVLFILGYLGLR
jgi:hypothetical protein